MIICDKIKYYADRAFRRRGILVKRWGTGRRRVLGLGGMMLGLAALALAFGVTALVSRLPVPVRRPPAAIAPVGGVEDGNFSAYPPALYRPARYSLPFRPLPGVGGNQ